MCQKKGNLLQQLLEEYTTTTGTNQIWVDLSALKSIVKSNIFPYFILI